MRSVDPVQFDQRRLSYEFDMIQNRWDQSLSPGNEQWFYWGSAAADNPGTRNYMGVKDPAIDAMIAALLEARDHTDFVSAVRALDRALIAGFYTIPLFNVSDQWIARWNRIERPSTTALSGYLPETWWSKGQPALAGFACVAVRLEPTALDRLHTNVPDASLHARSESTHRHFSH